MKYQPEIVLEADRNALPDTPQFANQSPLNVSYRRLYTTKQKWTFQPNPFHSLTDDACFKSADVGGNIG
jgi:hypothetical protein